MAQAGIRRTEFHAAGAHGHTRFCRAWLPARPERALLVVHGYAEHSGRYERFGAWFAARGAAVHAYDHPGHGRSAGPRCHLRRFADLLDELDRVLQQVRDLHPGLPLFPVGHSMGGLAVAALAADRQPEVTGVVTSGAALALSGGPSRGRLRAARALRRVAPRFALDSGLDPQGLSRDPDVVRAYREDPLIPRKMTVSLAAELLAAIPRTAASSAEVRVPMLMLHGEADPICPVAGSRAFHAGLRAPGSRLRTYPGLRHEIFNEPEQESVFGDLLDWVREREAAALRPEPAEGGRGVDAQAVAT
jgi:acylglycerol lipase